MRQDLFALLFKCTVIKQKVDNIPRVLLEFNSVLPYIAYSSLVRGLLQIFLFEITVLIYYTQVQNEILVKICFFFNLGRYGSTLAFNVNLGPSPQISEVSY